MWRRPTAAALRGTGLKPSHYKEPLVCVWPDCWAAIELYLRYQTQWIQGPNGPSGLNYVVLFKDLDRLGVEDEEHEEIMDYIRIIEAEALAKIYE
ncbi:DUF1799 domain-containing protein [Alcaligenes endophyticus]|uniref:DUF1799 domain-containing protein n=1 Tax=Alcaligenes endophyticus TaxID=1929088 RepID=A0ABT8EKA9_9BURK|nr:DUF1799 domain-containing protein [Alcaligenes endophyticus]MCX5592023.1 DUF1799 domain-containing protein [Alcaligenes endophyticus]MDN4121713.1 DUF1799 domain-containing protein [Alcaligenes endophyticus]